MSAILAALPQHYRVILCDLWGCVHNGVEILPGVIERLDRWLAEQRSVIFLTNAPRPSSAVAEQLASLGLPDRLNGSIVSSGDVALAWMKKEDRRRSCTFLGSQADRQRLEGAGLRFVPAEAADTIVCCGFDERGFNIADYNDEIDICVGNGIEMLCLNPDRLVHRGQRSEPCAGAIADAYTEAGGVTRLFGKPYPDIYEHVMRAIGGGVNRDTVISIGDSIVTDYVGAANAGIDFVFVAGGIDQAAWNTDAERAFDRAVGLTAGAVPPIAVVPTLG